MLKRFALPLVVLYTLLLTIASLVNIGGVPDLGSSFDDKIYHFLAYAVFTLIYFNYLKLTSLNTKALLLSVVIAIGYGVLIELLQQLLTKTRILDVYDMLANFFGVVFAMLLVRFRKNLKLK